MSRTTLRVQFLLCSVMTVHFSNAVDYNYFGGLRSNDPCNSKTDKLNCQIQCGENIGACIENECYCMTVKKQENKGARNIISSISKRSEDDQDYSEFHDYDELAEAQHELRKEMSSQETPEHLPDSIFDNKPVLRHHIAHFCPNLEVARTCIRTCMKEGKPAFCGKDHVCYCGHKYSNKDVNDLTDASSVYAQFKDLYEKYFGPNYKQELKV